MGIPACLAGQSWGGIPACLAVSPGGGVWSWGVSGPRGCLVPGGLVPWGVGKGVGEGVRGVGEEGKGVGEGGKGDPHFLGGNFFLISAFFGDTPPPPPRKQSQAYGERAAGTHPTGMHSCFEMKFPQEKIHV